MSSLFALLEQNPPCASLPGQPAERANSGEEAGRATCLETGDRFKLVPLRISRLSEFKLVADLCMNVAYSFNVKMGETGCELQPLIRVLAMKDMAVQPTNEA